MPSAERWLLGPEARLTVRADSPLATALRAFLPDDLYAPAPDAVPADVHDLQPDGPGFVLTRGTLRICTVARLEEIAPALEKLVSAWILAFTPGAAVLHAALLRDQGRTFLLPAERRSGKSTLCLLRTQRGAEYGGDDLIFLDHATQTLLALPKAVTLKEGSFPFAPDHLPTHHDPVRGRIRYWFPPTRLTGAVPVDRIDAILLPRYEAGSTAAVAPVSAPLAALSLVQQLFGGLDRDPRHLGWVQSLAAIPAYSLTYPDADAMHRLLDGLGAPS